VKKKSKKERKRIEDDESIAITEVVTELFPYEL
jgi:hypothetical protein